MDAALRARLAEIAGDKFVDGDSVSPSTAEQVEQVCLACAEAGARIHVTSAPATPATTAGGAVVVSLSGIDPVDVELDRLVVRAGAGATLGAVRQAAEKVGLAITGASAASAAAADTRVGEVIARGQVSRRALTGIEAVLPGGGRVSAGGAVLKDVAGYDLIGALLGSGGRLALVTAATFRLQPQGVAQEAAEPAGIPRPVLGEALEAAFDPQRLLAARS
jgi:FAD/FMN-containing dehydrogenase